MEGRYDEVYNYLMRNEFPFEFNKIKRQNLVRYAAKFTLVDDVLLYKGKRAIKYKEECKMVFKEIHSSPTGGHYGRFKSRNEVCARYYWPGITMDIEKWCCECECQEVGKTPVVDSKPDCVHVSSVWEYVGMDLTGPLPMTISGHVFILTITDYFSKWVEALPLKTKSAMEVARNLCSVIYRHGCPVRNLSDQDREFINEVNSSLCELLGITWCAIVADYPEKNNENTRRALTKLVNEHKNDWDMFLEPTLFSLRLEVNGTTRSSPFKLMYGREARLPSEVPEQLPLSHVTLPGHENIGKFAEDRATDIERERKQEAEENSGKDNAQDKSRKILKGRGNTGNSRKRSASAVRTSEERVLDIWTRKNIHQVEAVVGPYKLFNSSFKTLHGSNWLSDEGCVFPLSAVVSFALFSGNFQCVTRMKIPDADVWLCPYNTGKHWIIVMIKMSEKSVIVLDPFGKEDLYERNLLSNWRDFLKMRTHSLWDEVWTTQTLQHEKQVDGSSCGVLILKFAEEYVLTGHVIEVRTDLKYVKSARTKIACTLIEHGDYYDYSTR